MRAAEGTPAMLVGRCSSELSGHRPQGKLKKSQPPSEADLSRRAVEGPAVRLSAATTLFRTDRPRRPAPEMLQFVKDHGLEGLVAKRFDSADQLGQRTGLWSKYRIDLRQEFVVGGYVPSNLGVDSLVVGVYRGKDLIYAARVRAGRVPATRRELFDHLKHLQTPRCPFVNLPEAAAGRWGQELTAEKMEECFWVRPEVVTEIQFLEWTGADHLRHTKFVRLRDDKDPSKVITET